MLVVGLRLVDRVTVAITTKRRRCRHSWPPAAGAVDDYTRRWEVRTHTEMSNEGRRG